MKKQECVDVGLLAYAEKVLFRQIQMIENLGATSVGGVFSFKKSHPLKDYILKVELFNRKDYEAEHGKVY